jgi:hypothetical protein
MVDGADTYNYSSAALSNLVNEAVGAQTRFVRGIVVDNEKKANEAYRINFVGRNLVGDHDFTQGIYPSSTGQYQWYNGTGITIDPCARFADVKRGSWYHSAVDFVLEHGLMSGTGADKFGPTVKLTREMFVTILWQLAGKPKPSIANPFTDVKVSDYYYRLYRRNLFSQFVLNYLERNKGVLLSQYPDFDSFYNNFNVDDVLLNEFYAYAAKEGVADSVEFKCRNYVNGFASKYKDTLDGEQSQWSAYNH